MSGEVGARPGAGVGSVLPGIGGLGQGNLERGRKRGSDQYSLILEGSVRGTGSGTGSGGRISTPWDWRVGSGELGAGQGAGIGSVLPGIGGLGQGNWEWVRERGSDQYSLRLEACVRGTGSGAGSGGRISSPWDWRYGSGELGGGREAGFGSVLPGIIGVCLLLL